MSLEQRAAAFRLDIDDIVTGGQPALTDPASQVTSPAPSEWRQAIMPEKRVAPPSGFAGRFNWPVEGKLLSGFGSKGGGVVNDGLNIAVSEGTPILAAADGVVAYSGDEIDIFGGLILINHGSGWVTAYGHAARLQVERVTKGPGWGSDRAGRPERLCQGAAIALRNPQEPQAGRPGPSSAKADLIRRWRDVTGTRFPTI